MTTPAPDVPTARMESDVAYPVRSRGAEAQFAPGTIVAGRYRIASILGSGGMGEVYRADDMRLGQQVALKFLPARLARDPVLLERRHDEVRLGRQVAHPNVCRIYDIIDWDGAHFVAMEYVDGEDLSRLLHRIGRLAHDKAVEIARGIAAGLAAAHAKGILHRDLKPANVMIDSHGVPRIMDFGLALAAEDDSQQGVIAGTPAYMAPEQLAGQPATIQSDLYALGLVLYELVTGKRAHNARTLPERVRDLTSEITTPSAVIRDVDPAVERIILRCLSNEPVQRPRSAREVIEALPGGDPLALALAAGETPSPRLVAAAGAEGSLSRAAAWSLLGAAAVTLAMLLGVRGERAVANYMPPAQSPAVLHHRAEEILRTLGVPAGGKPIPLMVDRRVYLAWVRNEKRWESLRNGPAPFVYRLQYGMSEQQAEVIPLLANAPGWTSVEVDPQGRLAHLIAAPATHWLPQTQEWRALLEAAGLDAAKLQAIPPDFAPPAPFDSSAAWRGTYPGDATPIRVEAASWRGTPTFFRITGLWDDVADPMSRVPFSNPRVSAFILFVSLIVALAGILLAWRNLRLRRGDRQGAFRVAAAVFACGMAGGMLTTVFRDAGESVRLFTLNVERALFFAGLVFVLYLALEPFVRRRWPAQLIAWSRLIAGDVRNPMVGRDVLIGVVIGLLHALAAAAEEVVVFWLSGPTYPPLIENLWQLTGVPFAVAHVLFAIAGAVGFGFLVTVLLVLLAMVLRKRAIAVGAFYLVIVASYLIAVAGHRALIPFAVLWAAFMVYMVVRFGLLTLAVNQAIFGMTETTELGAAWSAPMTTLSFVLIAIAALWAFRTSLGGQSVFGEKMLAD